MPRLTRGPFPASFATGALLLALSGCALPRDLLYAPGSEPPRSIAASLVMGETSRHNPDMRLLSSWIDQAIAAMADGSLADLPSPPPGWIETVRRP